MKIVYKCKHDDLQKKKAEKLISEHKSELFVHKNYDFFYDKNNFLIIGYKHNDEIIIEEVHNNVEMIG